MAEKKFSLEEHDERMESIRESFRKPPASSLAQGLREAARRRPLLPRVPRTPRG